jgi:OOP family OmpA-OmpF porin
MASTPPRSARRYRRRILAIGLIAGVALYVIGAPIFNDRIETDLERRVPIELAASGFVGVVASFSGQDGTLLCDQPLDDPEGAVSAAYDVWGVRAIRLDRSCRVNRAPTVATSTTTPPDETQALDATGTATSVSSSVDRTTATPLAGPTPTAELDTVADIVATSPGLSLLSVLIDQSGFDAALGTTSNGDVTLFAPTDAAFDALEPDVMANLRADPDLLKRVIAHHVVAGRLTSTALSDGTLVTADGGTLDVVVEPDQIVVGGGIIMGADIAAANGVVHTIDRVLVPDGIALASANAPAPVTATFDIGTITFEGTVASEVERAALVGAATSVLDAESVIDLLMVDPEVGLDAETTTALAQLVMAMPANLLSGVSGFDGTALFTRGTYLTGADREAMVALAQAVGAEATFEPRRDATADDANRLEADLNAYVAANPILFEPSSATLSATAAGVIDAIVRRAEQFGSVAITVEGHTDSDGNPSENLTLSRQRALAVRDALVQRGLPQASIEAEGFGSQRPILVGGVEDKDASRRVEFRVVAST